MTRPLATGLVALALLALLPPPATGQEPDWTFNVPVQLDRMPPEATGVQVRCLVAPETQPLDFPDLYDFLATRSFIGSAGGPVTELEGVNMPPQFFGAQEVPIRSNGVLSESVRVPVWATEDADDAAKSAITQYACALLVTIAPNGYAVKVNHPETGITHALEGTNPVLVVTGQIN